MGEGEEWGVDSGLGFFINGLDSTAIDSTADKIPPIPGEVESNTSLF